MNKVIDFLVFRRMISPLIIQALFWLSTITFIFIGITDMFNSEYGFFKGFGIMVFGILCTRLGCELLILFFRMNETLTDIKNK